MLHLCLLSCILTLSITYSRCSLSGQNGHQEARKEGMRSEHISAYMWEVYMRSVNASVSEFDVVKELYPKMSDLSFESLLYRNDGKQQLEFFIPESQQGERLVQAEMRIIPEGEKFLETSFRIYFKADKWLFLGQKKVSDVNVTYISFPVTPATLLAPGVATFLVLSPRREGDLRPALLLSYRSDRSRGGPARRKRSPRPEDFEEETNRIWEEEMIPRSASAEEKSVRSNCRRKSLYIKFSEIDFDSWVVAPSGYEAFQCVGKCTFPVSEHLSPTKHAILQTLVHNAYPWKASRACCVPTRLEPISLLYVDGDGVLTYRFRYHDMVVAECGCR